MKLTTKELTLFAMLGTLMYASKMIMEMFPNIHLLGVFTIAFTIVYRKKALYPIYIYVLFLVFYSPCPLLVCPHKSRLKRETTTTKKKIDIL